TTFARKSDDSDYHMAMDEGQVTPDTEQEKTDYRRWLNLRNYPVSWDWRAAAAAALAKESQWICDLGCGGRQVLRSSLPSGIVYLPSDIHQWTDDTVVCDVNEYQLPLAYLQMC